MTRRTRSACVLQLRGLIHPRIYRTILERAHVCVCVRANKRTGLEWPRVLLLLYFAEGEKEREGNVNVYLRVSAIACAISRLYTYSCSDGWCSVERERAVVCVNVICRSIFYIKKCRNWAIMYKDFYFQSRKLQFARLYPWWKVKHIFLGRISDKIFFK